MTAERENPNDAFAEAADEGPAATDRLETISRLAQRQLELERELKDLDEQQKRVKKELNRIAQVDLPEAMDEVNLAQFRLADGSEVDVQEGVDASITKANAGEAHRWLEEHGFGDLIKRQVEARIPQDQPELAESFREFLTEQGIAFDEKEAVHPQTLKKFVREQLEKGIDIPEDLFGVFNYRKAKITPAG